MFVIKMTVPFDLNECAKYKYTPNVHQMWFDKRYVNGEND